MALKSQNIIVAFQVQNMYVGSVIICTLFQEFSQVWLQGILSQFFMDDLYIYMSPFSRNIEFLKCGEKLSYTVILTILAAT